MIVRRYEELTGTKADALPEWDRRDPMVKSWLSTQEAAADLGVSPGRVRHLLLAGQLPGEKLGRDWMIRRADLERFKAEGFKNPGRITPPSDIRESSHRARLFVRPAFG